MKFKVSIVELYLKLRSLAIYILLSCSIQYSNAKRRGRGGVKS